MAVHLHEFLYRGRPEGSSEPPAYHVILADDGTDAFGRPTIITSHAMTPEQARERGFGLPEILKAINAGVLAENTALKVEIATLKADMNRRAESTQSAV